MTEQKKYRACVGIALFNRNGDVFVGERIDTPNAWQMPQGGIDAGEDVIEAAYRELYEETGVVRENAELLELSATVTQYDFPKDIEGHPIYKSHLGQRQNWVAFRFKGDDSDIDLDAHEEKEFAQWEWSALKDVSNRIVPFKRKTYDQVISMFSKYTK